MYRDSVGGEVKESVWGTYDRLESGFLKMTVDSADGTDGPAPGDQAYALDIPGFAFVLHPLDSESDDLHLMVAAGECPESAMDGNWVMVRDEENVPATDPEAPFFGTFYFDPSTQVAKIPSMYSLVDFAERGTTEPADGAECANGVVDLPDADMFVTESGIMTVRLRAGDQGFNKFIFGVPNEQTDGLSALNGEYAGLAFNSRDETGQKIMPVHTTCDAGTCTGAEVTDIESGTVATDGTVEISLNEPNSPALGMVTGTITQVTKQETTDGQVTSSHIACAASTKVLDTDRTILSCVGMSPDNPEAMFSVLMTSIN